MKAKQHVAGTDQSSSEIETPCVAVCRLDPVSGLCTGCARSLAEIAAWGTLSAVERRRLMAVLPARRPVVAAATGDKDVVAK